VRAMVLAAARAEYTPLLGPVRSGREGRAGAVGTGRVEMRTEVEVQFKVALRSAGCVTALAGGHQPPGSEFYPTGGDPLRSILTISLLLRLQPWQGKPKGCLMPALTEASVAGSSP
jgi:hypothetical protein